MSVRALRRGSIAASRVAEGAPPANTLYLPGTAGNYVSTPDSVPNSVLGDIDLRVKVRLLDWTPVGQITLVGKWPGTSQRSFRFLVRPDGSLRLNRTTTSTGGGVAISSASDPSGTPIAATGFVDGSTHWVRSTLDITNGTNSVWSFYTSEDYNPSAGTGTWTQLGVPVLATIQGSAHNSTGILELGSNDTGTTGLFEGNIYYVEVRDGINGTVVQTFDATAVTPVGTRDPSSVAAGGPWTMVGSAWDWAAVTP